jgi:hypothetical protein
MTEKSARALVQRVAALEKLVHALRDAPGKQNEASVGPQKASCQEGDTAKGKPSVSAEVPPAPSYTQKAKHPWYKALNGWKTLLECIAIPFAIGYAIVTYSQWQDLRHNFKVDQRAWVTAARFSISTELAANNPTNEIRIYCWLQNTGKTPALDTFSQAEYIFSAQNKEPVSGKDPFADKGWFALPRPEEAGTSVIAPGSNPRISTGQFSFTNPDFSTLRLYLKREIVVFIIAKIRYRDIFNRAHWTTVCAFHAFGDPIDGFRLCRTGNRIDEE